MTMIVAILDSPIIVEPRVDSQNSVVVNIGTQSALDIQLSGGTGNVTTSWIPTEVSFIYKVTEDERRAKKIKLPSAPVSNLYVQHVNGGVAMIIGRDYRVIGEFLSWDLLGLDGVMGEGDELFIRYFI